MRVYHVLACLGKSEREDSHMPKTPAIQPQQGSRPLGRIEVLPNAIHSIAVRAIIECYGVVGITAPRLHNGRAVLLAAEQRNQGVQVRLVNEQIIIEVFVELEYGLRITEIAQNIKSRVKFSVEKMLGVSVSQVNVNVQGLGDVTEQTNK